MATIHGFAEDGQVAVVLPAVDTSSPSAASVPRPCGSREARATNGVTLRGWRAETANSRREPIRMRGLGGSAEPSRV